MVRVREGREREKACFSFVPFWCVLI